MDGGYGLFKGGRAVRGPRVRGSARVKPQTDRSMQSIYLRFPRQQALFCEARARADVAAPEKLGWESRYALATKWPILRGVTSRHRA